MNASALNSASIPAPGQSAPNAASGAGAANNPLAVFDALLGALFSQGDAASAAPVVASAAGGAGKDASAAGNKAPGKTSGKLAQEAPDAKALGADPTDANSDLMASLLGAPTTVAEANPDAVKTGPVEQAAAFGQDKTKRLPVAPTINNATSQAAVTDDGDVPATSSQNTFDLADVTPEPQHSGKTASNVSTALNTSTTPTAPSAPSANVVAAAATGQASTATQAARAPEIQAAAQADAAPEAVAADSKPFVTPPPAAAGLVARPETAAPPAARDAKAERTKGEGSAKTSSHMRPTEAVDRPVHSKGAEPPPKVTAAPVDVLEPRVQEVGDTEVSAETPEAGPQGETRASAQTSTPAPIAHAVRGTPETVATLAAQMVQKLAGKSTRFDLELNPGGLGKVDVRVEIGANGQLTAAMTFDNPQAAADLKARSSELQRALEQAGFEMAGGLSFDVAGEQGQQQRQAWQDQNENNGSAFRGQAFRAALDTAGDAADAAVNGALRLRRGVSAGLDLRI